MVECLTRNRGVVDMSLTSVTVLSHWARYVYPCLILVQNRKIHPDMTEHCWPWTTESNQTKISTPLIQVVCYLRIDVQRVQHDNFGMASPVKSTCIARFTGCLDMALDDDLKPENLFYSKKRFTNYWSVKLLGIVWPVPFSNSVFRNQVA